MKTHFVRYSSISGLFPPTDYILSYDNRLEAERLRAVLCIRLRIVIRTFKQFLQWTVGIVVFFSPQVCVFVFTLVFYVFVFIDFLRWVLFPQY